MQALIANNGGNLYVNGYGSLNVGFAGYTQNLINAVIYNRSGNVYISGYPWITTDKANITNQSVPLYNEGGYMEIDGGYFVGCVNRAGGGNAVALRCGSWATKTVISGGNFSAVNPAYPESEYAMGVIGSSPVEISGGWFYKGVKTDNGKTLNDYVVSGKKVYKAEEAWEVCDPKVEEVEIKVPPLVVGKDFPVPECVSDNAYVVDYAWYYSDDRTIADGAKVQNTEYKLHVIVYTDDGKMFDWTSCTIHFNDSTGEVYMCGDTFVNTYAYFTPVEIISGSVGVTDYVAPVVGKEPVKPTNPTGVDYNVSQIWYEVPEIGNKADAKTFTGAFEHGKIYCLALTFTALSGKAFDENIKVSVDGNVVEYERLQDNKIRAVLYTALNHDFSKYVSNGNGTHKIVCADCGAVQEGHDKDVCTFDAGKVTKEATETAEGIKTYTCTVCGKTKTETIPKKEATKPDDKKPDDQKVDDKKPDDQKPETPKKDDALKDDKTGVQVKVLDPDKKEVVFVAPKDAKATTITVPATITVNGVTYKVTKINDGAFKGNKTVTKIVLPSSIVSIGKDAFNGCKKLKTITIPKNVTEIGANAFKGCVALTKITIPSKVVKIGANAFNGCKKLKTVTIKTIKLTTKTVGKNAFKGLPKKATMKVPEKQLKAYKKFMSKKGFKGKVKK